MLARSMTFSQAAADLVSLTKPRLSSLVVCTMAGGAFLAPGHAGWPKILIALIATTAVVGAANALNCWWERDSDRFMARTRNRPLPAGRMEPSLALWFGVSLALASLPPLFLAVNVLTGALGLLAFVSYVFVYTPLKRRTASAMLVGALPGALPPLMGWTAVTGRLEAGGLVLFAILFLWQIPHFIAIALFRKEEYARAQIKLLPIERGDAVARAYVVAYLIPLVAFSVLPFTLHLAGKLYLVCACVLGALFLWTGLEGFLRELGKGWARRLFLVSLVYLTGLFIALMVNAGHS